MAGCVVWLWAEVRAYRPAPVALVPDAPTRARSPLPVAAVPLEEVGFERLGPPRAGEWRAHVHERPQSFAEYVRVMAGRADRRALVLQPLGPWGPAERRATALVRELLEVYYQQPARIAPGRPLRLVPRRRGGALQYPAPALLERALRPGRPRDALAYVGLTSAELYGDELPFLFGLGDAARGVGVVSLEPHDVGSAGGLRRACKVAVHEVGHVLGLRHCAEFRCVMNGIGGLGELDAAPLGECPRCHDKLRWYLGFDPAARLAALERLYARLGFVDDASRLWGRALRLELTRSSRG